MQLVRTTIAILLGVAVSYAADGPTISGKLLSEDEMPVSGRIYIHQINAPCRQTPSGLFCDPSVNYYVNSDAEGNFRAVGVQPLSYVLNASGDGLADSAKWGSKEPVPVVDVHNGNSVSGLVLKISRAAEFIVRIKDPQHLYFNPCGSPVACSSLIVGVVFGTGGFTGAGPPSQDEDGTLNFRISIPLGLAFRLWVFTRDFTIVDESGNPIDTLNGGPTTPFTVQLGTCKQRFAFTITGRSTK